MKRPAKWKIVTITVVFGGLHLLAFGFAMVKPHHRRQVCGEHQRCWDFAELPGCGREHDPVPDPHRVAGAACRD